MILKRREKSTIEVRCALLSVCEKATTLCKPRLEVFIRSLSAA